MQHDSEAELLFLRDLADVEPPREQYKYYDDEDIYRLVPRPLWTGLEDEIWSPRSLEHDPQLEKVKVLMKRQQQTVQCDGPLAQAPTQLSPTKCATKLRSKKRRRHLRAVRRFLAHPFIDGFVNLSIFWALFSEDVRILCLGKAADYYIWSVHVVVMLSFLLEIVLRSYSQRGYFWSFYCNLDIVATLTMIFDWLPLLYTTSSDAGSTAVRAAKSARVGTAVARLVRVVRIIRLIKLMVRPAQKRMFTDDDEDEERSSFGGVDETTPSDLSRALQTTITKKTIIFVLVLLIGQWALEISFPYGGITEPPVDDRIAYGLALLHAAIQNDTAKDITSAPFVPLAHLFRDTLEQPLQLESIWSEIRMPLFALKVHNFGPNRENFTFYPVSDSEPRDADGYTTTGFTPCDVDGTNPCSGDRMMTWQPNWTNPQRSVGRDWVAAVLPVNAPIYPDTHWPDCTFYKLAIELRGDEDKSCPNAQSAFGMMTRMRDHRTRDPSELLQEFYPGDWNVGDPGLMVEVWYGRKFAQDVQAFFNIMLILCVACLLAYMGFLLSRDVDSLVVRPIETMVMEVTMLAKNPAYKLKKVDHVKYETDALRVSLSKIASMLQVGFGEAGNNLIAENLRKGDTVDPMVPGRRLLGAFGFCIIDEYEEVLECLGEEILPFTNRAASIVHDAVIANGGQPNRNLGEAFLCVWKAPTDGLDPELLTTELLDRMETRMCDGALTAFRRCVRCVAQSARLQAYNEHEEILKAFGGEYSTRIGYGLHYGWAIEGAVGTNIKIDCSYLSPNVNLAARLESATKMYGVNILMSEAFYTKLSPPVRQGLRRVDVVCLKGSSIPMAIFTCDRSNGLYVAPEAIEKYGEENVVDEFQRLFESGMDCFVGGVWATAKMHFEAALGICPRDQPATRLIMHMDTPEKHPDYGLAKTPFVAPDGWAGYHVLLSK
jgi:class 3 adenylate cyclase